MGVLTWGERATLTVRRTLIREISHSYIRLRGRAFKWSSGVHQ